MPEPARPPSPIKVAVIGLGQHRAREIERYLEQHAVFGRPSTLNSQLVAK